MKHIPLFVCGFAFAATTTTALTAQARPKPVGDVGQIAGKPPIISGSEPIQRTRIGERYRLWMSFNPTDCNDPMYPGKSAPYDDHAFECYGQLLLNGQVMWDRPKSASKAGPAKVGHLDLPTPLKVNPRLQGYRLNRDPQNSGASPRIFEYDALDGQPTQSTVGVSLKLYDRDDPTFFDDGPYNTPPDRHDDMFAGFNLDLNLLKMGEGNYYWNWQGKDESGNSVGSNLYLYIEHVKTLYTSNKPDNGGIGAPPHVGPAIEKSKIPARIPSPGPILKRGHLKQQPR